MTANDILTAAQVGELLQVSARTVQRLAQLPIAQGGLPSFDVGTGDKPALRFWRADLLAWIESRKAPAPSLVPPLPRPALAPVEFTRARGRGPMKKQGAVR